ncbi:DUF4175 domain-containing protein [Pseudoxanthomonas sp. PXM02]|uniref:DUF4175 domain-containing protein n=1 Tax=Pseudoxanthomonas sp. PXM02 TaxID=2769294 RepID=UPI001CE11378|nr:DUF4175 domain-containing protein [Pseudoxanthomonas sp. PXM02]
MTLSATDRLAQVRRHAWLGQLLLGAAIPLAVGGVMWRLASPGVAIAITVAGIALLAFLAWRRTHAFDTAWLVRQLDAKRKDLDDSTDLILAPPAALTPLQQLQQARVRERLRTQPAPDLRTPWPWARIAALWIATAVVIATAALWPGRTGQPGALQPSDEPVPTAPGIPHLVAQRLHVAPPAYTGIAAHDEVTLDAKAPVGSRLAWTLRFEPQPTAAALVFHDGQRIALSQDGDTWQATHVLAKSTLYRVVAAGTEAQPPTKLRRLDAIPDRVPEVKVLAPDRGLSLVTVGQTRWALAFEARDDYGIAPTATLKLTLAQGSGENIAFKEHVMTLQGSGPAKSRRFTAPLDLRALGMAVGDDLIAQLTVQDSRSPSPQRAQSPGLILRWPADLGQESTGLEGLVKKVMPAYFRSQRQIIIDAEALQKQKRNLATDTFVTRSDTIGVDQRILRLRYGQFLGEEAEGEPQPPPTNDADDEHTDDDGHDHAGETAQADDGHGHGEATSATGASFGREADVLEAYGHTHDHAEAATLLDPETRATLKKALDQMWQSELHLRQGHPDQALPFAYKALEYIKQVQQATRIYLARVGPELPPIDETRRLGGDRKGIAPRTLGELDRPKDDDAAPARVWAALANDATPANVGDLDALQAWLRTNEARVPDALDLFAAIDEVRGDPACAACRQRLRALLWSASSQPPAQVPRRGAVDAAGRRYLDALRQEPTR